MHQDQIQSDADLVRQLLAEQLPHWARLSIEPVRSTGTANAMYRLGDDRVVRLPVRPAAAGGVEKEHAWLPRLAPHLPVSIPVPLALGKPSETYPLPWSVFPWLPGEDGIVAQFEQRQAALDLARFIGALESIDATGGPRPRAVDFGRGVALAKRDEQTKASIRASRHLVDTDAVTAAWVQSLEVPPWTEPPVWVHGDIASGNLLFLDGRLSAVIDFAALAVGDPAADLIVAWEMFDAASRDLLRTELAVDDATWERGRGWALSTAIVALPYYEHTNAFMADQARHKLAVVLET